MSEIASIILAAGNGTRMKSAKPKVLHTVCGKPMLWHVLQAVKAAGAKKNVVVAQSAHDDVQNLAHVCGAETALQKQQLGTADAAKAAKTALKNFVGNVVILSGDTPLVSRETIKALLAGLKKADISMLVFEPDDTAAYGRVITNGKFVERIVEFKDASSQEKQISLCNSGIYALPCKSLFTLLEKVQSNNAKSEFYLTDIVQIAAQKGLKTAYINAPEEEVLGVNTMAELATAEATMQEKLCAQALAQGVQMIAPETVFLSADTKFGQGVILQPNVIFGENVEVGDNVTIGPFAHIRAGTKLGKNSKIGNFVEVKNSKVGASSKINHLSYIGDAEIGNNANIGAGTITCNYDGYAKHKTKIGDGVFVGSNTALVAPVALGNNAIIAAGSTICVDVGADALAIERNEQKNLAGAAIRYRTKRQKNKAGKGLYARKIFTTKN